MRTQIVTLTIFSFSILLVNSCTQTGSSEGIVKEVTEKKPLERPSAKPAAYRPTITVAPGDVSNPNIVISSSLNHYTSLTVGVFDEQYAAVIQTGANSAVADVGSNNPELPFGDELEVIEDEIVEETIRVPNAIPVEEIVVAEGPGVSPFTETGPKDDVLSEKGEEEKPDSYSVENKTFDINNINDAYLLGKFNPATHPDFTKVSTNHASRAGMYVRKDVYEAFMKMYEAALADGIELKILSATRSFSGQKRIWEAKWTGSRKVSGQDLSKAIPFGTDRAMKILEYSAMPGTSRHHWGTDLDLCALNNAFFDQGKGQQIYDWLNVNARDFGFYQPYTDRTDGRVTGHNEEKWHWSYLPVSKLLTIKYTQILSNDKIDGFLGQETAPYIQILENYVLGINPECK